MTRKALLSLCLVVHLTSAAQLTCGAIVVCPCGSTGGNVTLCAGPSDADPCARVSGCRSCEHGLSACSECPEGYEGPFCTTRVSPAKSRPKRQFYYSVRRPRRPGASAAQVSGECPNLDSPKLGGIRCVSSQQERTCVGKCLPGYTFEGYDAEEITLQCRGGAWAPLTRFPDCRSEGKCDLEMVRGEGGSFNCTTGMDGTRCDVTCSGRYKQRYFCYPGRPWEPGLPRCVRPKGASPSVPAEEKQRCRCEHGGRCDSRGKCVCPAGRTRSRCQTAVPQRVKCPDPGFVTNGRRKNTDGTPSTDRQTYEEGQSVVYSCTSEEYALQGASLLTCRGDRTWSRPLPKCIRPRVEPQVTCPDPGQVSNAERLNSDGSPSTGVQLYKVGQSVVYTCRAGFALQRRSLITCLASGAWSARTPHCTRVTPPAPPPTTTTATPDAHLNFCADPGVDVNGVRRPSSPGHRRGFPQGSHLEYSCKKGYVLSGEPDIFCVVSGRWSAARPRCEVQQRTTAESISYCDHPGPISNGKFVYFPSLTVRRPVHDEDGTDDERYPQGARLRYSCNRGYALPNLEKTVELTCQNTGLWSDSPPKCLKEPPLITYCDHPGTPPNGRVEYAPALDNRSPRPPESDDEVRYPQGGRLRFSCNSGYRLSGHDTLTCRASGSWSAPLPTCVESISYCDHPGPISNGQFVYFPSLTVRRPVHDEDGTDDDRYPQGARLRYSCNRGYALPNLERTVELTCEDTGFWSDSPPKCLQVPPVITYCDHPGTPPNGRVEYAPALDNRSPRPPESDDEVKYPQGGRLRFSCNGGYRLSGDDTLTCRASGSWSAPLPTCVRVVSSRNVMFCENPGPVMNGEVESILPGEGVRGTGRFREQEDPDEYPQGSRLEYSCREGYQIDGSSRLTCQPSGFWSADPPTCLGECGRSFMQTSHRVLNGLKTESGEWPWVVAIFEQLNNSTRLVCGGAVLNTHTVVTAAHCLNRTGPFVLRFGKFHRSIRNDDEEVLIRRSTRVIMHPDFKNTTLESDIGLVMFQPRIRYSPRVQPICLPTAESTAKNLMTGKVGYVAGWGITERETPSDELLLAKLPVLTTEACRDSYRRQNITLTITRNMFCAGHPDARQSTCEGDSGSPLVFYDAAAQRYALEGLVSFGVDGQCGLQGRYTVFTKVFQFLPWIYRNWQ